MMRVDNLVSPRFRYSVDQQSERTHDSGSGGDLSPPSGGDGMEMEGMEGMEVLMILVLLNPLECFQETLTPPCHIGGEEYEEKTIAHTCRRLRKTKNQATKASPNYDNQVTRGYAHEQQIPSTFTETSYCNWSCGSDSYDGGPYNYGYNQTDADWGVHYLTHLTRLILVVNCILVNPIQVPKIMAIFRFSTTGLLITETIIIIVPQFMAEIRVQLVNFGWMQRHYTFFKSKGQMQVIWQIKVRKPTIKSLLVVRSGVLRFDCTK
ncbi:hypothetical protein Cgig2_018630 [Carnegiea gigantea]|uniref:Uncharacterized protein n=1 Tax=Carnegiea gigantea TaxID=171969 RepID=A0A9Q1KGD4_9CARY|nr:hypothetical protein Cgig2_018630 [Carnegiea gigantea]